jgi:hypothetical protein
MIKKIVFLAVLALSFAAAVVPATAQGVPQCYPCTSGPSGN